MTLACHCCCGCCCCRHCCRHCCCHCFVAVFAVVAVVAVVAVAVIGSGIVEDREYLPYFHVSNLLSVLNRLVLLT